MVRFHTLQEKIRTILYEYHFIWYITVRGTPKVLAIITADTFFFAGFSNVIYCSGYILIKVIINIISNLTELFLVTQPFCLWITLSCNATNN